MAEAEEIARKLPKDVKQWLLHRGAIPDSVWFGKYAAFMEPANSGCTRYRMSDLGRAVAAELRKQDRTDG